MKLNKVLLMMAWLIGVVACGNNDRAVDAGDHGKLSISVNGEHYTIALPAAEPQDLKTLNTEAAADIRIENASEFKALAIDGHDATSGQLKLNISELSSSKTIGIDYTTAKGQKGTAKLNTLNSALPRIEASGKAELEGDFYLSYIYQRLIMKYDNNGRLLYYRYEPTALSGTLQENGYWDFKKHTMGGKTYYSYHAPDDRFSARGFMGYNPGMRVLMDANYTPIDTIHAKASRDGYLADGEPIDGHDFYFFSPTHYIISAYVDRQVGDHMFAVAYLQEVQDGEVIFDWWSSDHPEMEGWTSPTFDTSYDYVHFNSIQVLPDGNWLCSFRHLSSIVKIDRAGETGDIFWRIDGESLPENQNFCGQHYVTLYDDGTLTLFDNGNGHDPQLTRVLRLNVNAQTGAVVGGGNMLNPGDDYFSQACGAVQLFGQRFTVGWGWSIEEGNNTRLVTEHDATGREIFGLRRSAVDSLPNSTNPSYRCVKYK